MAPLPGVILQARMGSTRRPGKVIADLGGVPFVVRVVERLAVARSVRLVVVATPSGERDRPLRRVVEEFAASRRGGPEIRTAEGPEDDVLERYALAAERYDIDPIVRATADNPFVDPDAVDGTIARLAEGFDYVSAPGYPSGGGVEAFTRAALERARREARSLAEREHVTPYFYRNPGIFRLGGFEAPPDRRAAARLTVDTDEDLEMARRLYAEAMRAGLMKDGIVDLAGALALLARRPEIAEINRHVVQKAVGA